MLLGLGRYTSKYLNLLDYEFALKKRYRNTFNLSFLLLDEGDYCFTLRALPTSGYPPFDAIFGFRIGTQKELLNLTEIFRDKYGLEVVADPKVFRSDDEVWCTFNTGYSHSSNNKIFLARLLPDISEPMECHLDGRAQVEKNWAFFKKSGVWHCLYSLDPLTILEEDISMGCSSSIFFKRKYVGQPRFNNYTIGSQLCLINGQYFFIGHRKFFFNKKRLYLGSLFQLTTVEPGYTLKLNRRFLFHNLKGLLGSKIKWNKNLFSCTYFAGICFDETSIYLSYGVNDLDFCLAEISKDKLCM